MLVLANILQPLIDIFEPILVFFHDNAGFSWGASIIALTVVVRAALLPLAFKQFRSMQQLQKHAPEMKALQQKYKDDKQRLNEEMMKFYRENKVNPLGSCLPLLLQLPVFISLFYLLRQDLKSEICPQWVAAEAADGVKLGDVNCGDSPFGNEADAASFLFIPDLTNNASGWVLVALILLYVGSQLASSLLMSTTADKNQRRLILALPLIFVPFIIGFPAGLLVYWITTNIWTMGQQFTIRKIVGPLRPPDAAPATSGGGLAGLLGLPSKEEPASENPKGRAAPKGKAATGGAQGKGNGKADVPKGQKAAKPPPRSGPPPRPPRKKKKRSGRRR